MTTNLHRPRAPGEPQRACTSSSGAFERRGWTESADNGGRRTVYTGETNRNLTLHARVHVLDIMQSSNTSIIAREVGRSWIATFDIDRTLARLDYRTLSIP